MAGRNPTPKPFPVPEDPPRDEQPEQPDPEDMTLPPNG